MVESGRPSRRWWKLRSDKPVSASGSRFHITSSRPSSLIVFPTSQSNPPQLALTRSDKFKDGADIAPATATAAAAATASDVAYFSPASFSSSAVAATALSSSQPISTAPETNRLDQPFPPGSSADPSLGSIGVRDHRRSQSFRPFRSRSASQPALSRPLLSCDSELPVCNTPPAGSTNTCTDSRLSTPSSPSSSASSSSSSCGMNSTRVAAQAALSPLSHSPGSTVTEQSDRSDPAESPPSSPARSTGPEEDGKFPNPTSDDLADRIAEIRSRIQPQVKQIVGQYINQSLINRDDESAATTRNLRRRLGLEMPSTRLSAHRLGQSLHAVREDDAECSDNNNPGKENKNGDDDDDGDDLDDEDNERESAPPPPDVSRHRRALPSDVRRRSLDRDWFSRWRSPSLKAERSGRWSPTVSPNTGPGVASLADVSPAQTSTVKGQNINHGRAASASVGPSSVPESIELRPTSASSSSCSSPPSFFFPAPTTAMPPLAGYSASAPLANIMMHHHLHHHSQFLPPHTPESDTVSSGLSGRSASRSSTPATPFSPDRELRKINRISESIRSSRSTMSILSNDGSFDLVSPVTIHAPTSLGRPDVAAGAIRLLSSPHMEALLADPIALQRFTGFLARSRPGSLPMLVYFLDATKALRAIGYANAIADALDPIPGHDFTRLQLQPTMNTVLEQKAQAALDVLTNQDLPAYVTDVLLGRVSSGVAARITGVPVRAGGKASKGVDFMAESFCLTDASMPGNPVVFASEEFYRICQYTPAYVIGRGPSFLQGPATSPSSVKRFRDATLRGHGHTEVIVNYRRDGTAFPNLVMIAPLTDNRGVVRYYVGAQVDVSNLIHLDGDMLSVEERKKKETTLVTDEDQDEFRDLCEMFNAAEVDTVRTCGGRMHRNLVGCPASLSIDGQQEGDEGEESERILISPAPPPSLPPPDSIFRHFLLVRPAPSLRILFTSPSMRLPGIVQTNFLSRIGGSARVRNELEAAMTDGRSVTAKVKWLSGGALTTVHSPITSSASSACSGRSTPAGAGLSSSSGRSRWIHCTPMHTATGEVGVWMVVLVDEAGSKPVSRFRESPPVASNVRTFPSSSSAFGSTTSFRTLPSVIEGVRAESPTANWQL